MSLITFELLHYILELNGSHYASSEAAAAYLNFLVEPLAAELNQLESQELRTWERTYLPFLSRSLIDNAPEDKTDPELVELLIDRIVTEIVTAIIPSYDTTEGVVEYHNLTLTPWDIRFITNLQFNLRALFPAGPTGAIRLPVTVLIEGKPFIHSLTQELAMGMLLFAQVADVDLEMEMYGAPLIYFVEGQDDEFKRYDNYATEGEYNIRMVGSPRRYFFFGSDFLRGIASAAGWFGLDHHAYWTEFRDMNGNPLTF